MGVRFSPLYVAPDADVLVSMGGMWTPANLGTALLAWWRGAPESVTLAGSNVAAWRDAVASYSAAQATGAAQPVYSATSFRGMPGITFDGTADYLEIVPSPAGIPMATTSFELWALVRQDALAGDTSARVAVTWGGASNFIGLQRIVTGGVNRARAVVAISGVANNAENTGVDFSGRHVVRVQFTTTSLQVDVDGVAGTPIVLASPISTTTRFRIGASAAGVAASFWNGGIAQIPITLPLSAGQAAKMYAYYNPRIA